MLRDAQIIKSIEGFGLVVSFIVSTPGRYGWCCAASVMTRRGARSLTQLTTTVGRAVTRPPKVHTLDHCRQRKRVGDLVGRRFTGSGPDQLRVPWAQRHTSYGQAPVQLVPVEPDG